MLRPFPPLLVFLSFAAACQPGDPSGPGPDRPVPPAAPVATRLEVSPGHLRIPVGESVTLTARGVTASGAPAPVPGGITFASRLPAIATVTPDGRVTAVAPGDAELVVRWSGEAVILDVSVLGPPVEVGVPADSIVVAPGFSVDFRVVARDAAGHDLGEAGVRLVSEDPTRAAVVGDRVEGRRPGRTAVIIDWAGGRAVVPVLVRDLPGVLVMSVGELGYAHSRNLEFQRFDGSGATRLEVAEPVWGPALSPDGRSVAVMRSGLPIPAPRLGLLDPGTATVRWLPGTDDVSHDLAWSPDGQHLLYTAFRSWDDTSRVMEAAVAGEPPRLVAYGSHARWIEPGRLLAWVCGRWEAIDGGSDICVDVPDAPVPEVRFPQRYRVEPSPTGELATLRFLPSKQVAIELRGGPVILAAEWVSGMSWSPDGQWLAVAAGSWNGDARAWILGADGAVRMWRKGRSTVSWGPLAGG